MSANTANSTMSKTAKPMIWPVMVRIDPNSRLHLLRGRTRKSGKNRPGLPVAKASTVPVAISRYVRLPRGSDDQSRRERIPPCRRRPAIQSISHR